VALTPRPASLPSTLPSLLFGGCPSIYVFEDSPGVCGRLPRALNYRTTPSTGGAPGTLSLWAIHVIGQTSSDLAKVGTLLRFCQHIPSSTMLPLICLTLEYSRPSCLLDQARRLFKHHET